MNLDYFRGQWIGRYRTRKGNGWLDDGDGWLILNVDDDRAVSGRIQVDHPTRPYSAKVSLEEEKGKLSGRISDVQSDMPYERVAAVAVPTTGELTGEFDAANDQLIGEWATDIGTAGGFSLLRSARPEASPADRYMSWKAFRTAMFENEALGKLCRGHDDASNALTTSFHRTGRRDLHRYLNDDFPMLKRLVEATLHGRFPESPNSLMELLSLGQHHGFPTPLLDFTMSPFVAAYFAFSTLPNKGRIKDRRVRIFVFDYRKFPYRDASNFAASGPRFAPLLADATQNPRSFPQQSVHVFSNVFAIERLIEQAEKDTGERFLATYDIDASERQNAMLDLSMMGITAASMFPGLDGACRSLAELWF